MPRLFGVIGLARDTLHREAPELARDADHVIIDGPPRVAALLRSALLAADLVLIPAQPSPFDGWASAEMLTLIAEARVFRPQLVARFVLNRCPARTVIARETAEASPNTIRRRSPRASASASSSPTLRAPAARLRARRRQSGRARDRGAGRRNRKARAMTARAAKRGFASRPGDAELDEGAGAAPAPHGAGDLYTARLTIDVTPALRGRIKIAAFQRGVTVADMLRDLLAREFPDTMEAA